MILDDCPLCRSKNGKIVLNLNCGNFDNSTLYKNAVVKSCDNCGHIYNRLSEKDFNGLNKYYNCEYAQTNLASVDKIGDRPGSSNYFTIKRFEQIYGKIKNYLTADSVVLDVGCAMGGFLSYLKSQGISGLYGIDLSENYVKHAGKNKDLAVKLGNADDIPYENNKFHMLFMDQVLEHLVNPRMVFREAGRVLKQGGYFCIGAPNAQRYSEYYIFDFYWFIMREHIQHFDIHHLIFLAESEGFELVDYTESDSYMMSETMVLPNLNAVFKFTGKTQNIIKDDKLKIVAGDTVKYIEKEYGRLKLKIKLIDELIKTQRPVFIWGIGREYLYLNENTNLRNCNIKGLLDINRFKQKEFSISGRKIEDVAKVSKSDRNSSLLITAVAHEDKIKEHALRLGFKGDIIDCKTFNVKN